MGDKSSKSNKLFLIFVGLFALACLMMLLGFIFVGVYCIPEYCEDVMILTPGGQSCCNITNGDYPSGSVEVDLGVDASSKAKPQTYVFNKQPQRVYVEQVFQFNLEDESGRSRYYYIDSVSGTEFKISLQSNEEVDIRYRYRKNKRSVYTIFYVDDVKSYSGSFFTDVNSDRAFFYVYGPKTMKGKLQITARWPRWSWKPNEVVMSCANYPCDFDLSDSKLADHDLYFVTVNEGTENVTTTTTASYDKGVWIPVVVVLIVGGFLLGAASCVLGVIFSK